jgi:hypothetical protein
MLELTIMISSQNIINPIVLDLKKPGLDFRLIETDFRKLYGMINWSIT